MNSKQCTKCDEIKPLNEYNKRSDSKDGLCPFCRECNRQYYQKWKERGDYKKNYEKNKEKFKRYRKQYRADNLEKIKEYQRRPDIRAKKNESQKRYAAKKLAEDPNWLKKYDGYNRYVKKDKDTYQKWLQKQAEYKRKRRKTDPAFKLRDLISASVYDGLHKNHCKKNNPTWQALPYTPEDLREHLESQFAEDMNWDNHGTYWHIDHIKPQAAFSYDSMDHPDFLKCWALDNLQPLPAKENIVKGSLYEGVRHRYDDDNS